MSKYKFIFSLFGLFIFSIAIGVSINIYVGAFLCFFGLVALIIARIAFKVKMNKIEIENEKLLNEKLKQERNK